MAARTHMRYRWWDDRQLVIPKEVQQSRNNPQKWISFENGGRFRICKQSHIVLCNVPNHGRAPRAAANGQGGWTHVAHDMDHVSRQKQWSGYNTPAPCSGDAGSHGSAPVKHLIGVSPNRNEGDHVCGVLRGVRAICLVTIAIS